MPSTSTTEAPDSETDTPLSPRRLDGGHRLPMGVQVFITDEVPARLPHDVPGESTRPDRRHRMVAEESGEYLFVGLCGGGGPPLPVQGPVDMRLRPGDICFYDVNRPPELRMPAQVRMKVFLLRRELLGICEAEAHRLTMAPVVARESSLGTLLSPLLSDMAHIATTSRPLVGAMLAWNAVNLLATLATEHLGEAAAGTRPPLVPKILDFIELHLREADLSPEAIARAHHISVRYLHKLFKDEGTTVGRWTQRRRLEECRRELVLNARGNQTIAAVANHWGFTSATHFSRVFRSAYGMSPRAWRDSAFLKPL